MGPPVAPWDGPLLRTALPETTTKTVSNLLIGYSVYGST